jgi:hypothetical protein
VLSFAAHSCRRRSRPSSRYLCVAAVVFSTAACTIAPEPPPTPSAVVQLSERYDRPTASLDQFVVEQLFDESVPNYTELKTLGGLSFVRAAIARALKTPDIGETAQGLDVQGSIAVHTPCPGWELTMTPDEAQTGYVDLVIGVDDSRVQRAFTGTVTACRFIASLGGQRAKVQASMQLEVDLGHSLAFGDPVPAILMRASKFSAEVSVHLSPAVSDGLWAGLSAELVPDGLKLELDTANRPLSLRIASDDLVETLIDLEPLDFGAYGTIVLGLRDDGSFNMRGRDGAWNCGGDWSAVCVRSD